MVALLPVDKSTIFRSEVSVSCKLIAASGDLYLKIHLCHYNKVGLNTVTPLKIKIGIAGGIASAGSPG
jgi:hypothetical protein